MLVRYGLIFYGDYQGHKWGNRMHLVDITNSLTVIQLRLSFKKTMYLIPFDVTFHLYSLR